MNPVDDDSRPEYDDTVLKGEPVKGSARGVMYVRLSSLTQERPESGCVRQAF